MPAGIALALAQAAIIKIGEIPIRMSTVYTVMRATCPDKPIHFFPGV
jgi:hypothetical protein